MTAERMQIQLNRTVTRRIKAVAAIIEASPMSVVMTALNGHLDMMEQRAISVHKEAVAYTPSSYEEWRLAYPNVANIFDEGSGL